MALTRRSSRSPSAGHGNWPPPGRVLACEQLSLVRAAAVRERFAASYPTSKHPGEVIYLLNSGDAGMEVMSSLRQVDSRLILAKLRRHLWSDHVAIGITADTSERPTIRTKIPLRFEVVHPSRFDERELLIERRQGEELRFIRGLLRMIHGDVGDLSVARTLGGQVVAISNIEYADRFAQLDAVAPGMYPRIGPHEAWVEGSYCLPEFRNLGALAALLDASCRHLAARGIGHARAIVACENQASLRACGRAGLKPDGLIRIDRYRLLRWSRSFDTLTPEAEACWLRATAPRAGSVADSSTER